MDININIPYWIGQKLYIVYKVEQFVRLEDVLVSSTPRCRIYEPRRICKSIQMVEEKYLKEIQINDEGIIWTFADNLDLTDNDEWDEDHSYTWYRDYEVNIFIDKIEADNYALSLNVMNELCK